MEEHFLGKVVAKAIITMDGKVLMVRGRRDDAVWDLPGGRINAGESIRDGLRREVHEELGMYVSFKRMISSEQLVHPKDGLPHLFITCEAAMDDPAQSFRTSSEELAEVKWVDKNTIKELKTFDNITRALGKFWE